MVRRQILKRASYFGVALILMLATVPIMPGSSAWADSVDCASDDATLTQLLGDAGVASFAFCGNIAKTLNLTRDVEIDLAGNTLTGKVVVYEGHNVTIRNGVIAGATINDNIVSNKGVLTLEDVDITANTYPAVNSNGGTTVINGGTYRTNGVTLLTAKNGGTMTANSGDFTGGLYGEVTVNGGKFTVDPAVFLGAGKDAYTFDGYWMVGSEATIVASDATVPKGAKVEIARVNAAEYNILSYDVKNSAGADAFSDVAITEEVSDTGEKVVYAEGLAQGRKEIDITNNSGKSAHVTLRIYEFQGVEDQVIFKGNSLPMEIASNKWNIGWSLVDSTDESVVTVSGNTVTAVGSGKATVTAEFNDTLNSQVTFDVYVYDFDENDADTLLIKKGKTATVNTDSSWDVEGVTSNQNVQLTDQHGSYSVKGLETGAAELTFSMSVNGQDFSKTVKAYVYEVVEKDVILEKGVTLGKDRINEIIDKGSDDVAMTFKKFGTDGVASNDGLILTGENAGDTEVVYRLSVDGKNANVKFNLHVWELVTENLGSEYNLGNEQTATETFEVYDNNGVVSYAVKNEAGEDATDVIVEKNGNEYAIRMADGAMPGTYTVEFVDTVFGQEVATKTVVVRVHQISITGGDSHYIVMTRNPLNASENQYDLNVVEISGFTSNRDITAMITNNSSTLNGVSIKYLHGGNWRITASAAGSYEIKFSDGVASKTINIYVMQFTFGQDSYHVRREDGMAGEVINAINRYWNEENARNRYWDTEFSMVNDETGAVVAEGYGVTPTVARDGEYNFKWCVSDGDCLQAGNYTITFKAYANRGDEFGGKTATKRVRLHIYEMVTPRYDTRYAEVGDTIEIAVSDENSLARISAKVVEGDTSGLGFARNGWEMSASTDYTRVDARKPGVYMVRYTDYMNNGTQVGTYDVRIVVIGVTEETLLVRKGEKVEIAGNGTYSPSVATDWASGLNYVAEENEDGEMIIKLDTADMDLGEHTIYVAHEFVEYDNSGRPAREDIKVATVIVYEIDSDKNNDPSDVTATTIEEYLDKLTEEGLADDLMESSFWRLWSIAGREDSRALFGTSQLEVFDTLRKIRNAIGDGEEISTHVIVYEYTEEELLDWVEEDLINLIEVSGPDGVKYYDISIYLTIGEGENVEPIGFLHQLNDEIVVKVPDIEDPDDGYIRQYTVARKHAGEDVETLVEGKDFFVENGALYVKSDRFSNYAVAYTDILAPVTYTVTYKVSAPETGTGAVVEVDANSSLVAMTATVLTVITLAGVAVFVKRK